jgi:hypothetical protein
MSLPGVAAAEQQHDKIAAFHHVLVDYRALIIRSKKPTFPVAMQ